MMSFPFIGNPSFYLFHEKNRNAFMAPAKGFSRNQSRMKIATANGPLTISLPLVSSSTKGSLAEVMISADQPWQKKQWQAVQSAYGKSAWFEFFETDIKKIWFTETHSLLELNRAFYTYFSNRIQWEYAVWPETASINSEEEIVLNPYQQVFAHKFGYISDLSVLDYLFNCGIKPPSFCIKKS